MKALKSLVVVLAVLAAGAGLARAHDGPEHSTAIMLVATERLAGSAFEDTVLVAAPLEQGGHLGFIVNHPTDVKLGTLFPDHAPSSQVVSPVYVGGPALPEVIFALAPRAPQGEGTVIALMPGLVAVLDGASVDRVIETAPNEARYYAGLVVWRPGELELQVVEGAWRVEPASVEAVLH